MFMRSHSSQLSQSAVVTHVAVYFVALVPVTFSQIIASAVTKAASTPGMMVRVYLPASWAVLGFLCVCGGGGENTWCK